MTTSKPLIITSGYGKSKYPAMYLADALITMDVPAVFLDPLDAEHGGFGKVSALMQMGEIEFYMFSRSASEEALLFAQKMCEMYAAKSFVICEDTVTTRHKEDMNENLIFIKYEREELDDNCPPTHTMVSAMRAAAQLVIAFKEEYDPDGIVARSNHPAKTQTP